MTPRIRDNDAGEITAEANGRAVRGWFYASEAERRQKMLIARAYQDGWLDGAEFINELHAEAIE